MLLESPDPDSGPLAAYVSGVAVECALRAKRVRVSRQINAGHDLIELAAESNYASRLKGGDLARLSAELSLVDRLWDNLLRYCSSSAYLRFLNDRAVRIDSAHGRLGAGELVRRVGAMDASRHFAEATYIAAVGIVRYGEPFWNDP